MTLPSYEYLSSTLCWLRKYQCALHFSQLTDDFVLKGHYRGGYHKLGHPLLWQIDLHAAELPAHEHVLCVVVLWIQPVALLRAPSSPDLVHDGTTVCTPRCMDCLKATCLLTTANYAGTGRLDPHYIFCRRSQRVEVHPSPLAHPTPPGGQITSRLLLHTRAKIHVYSPFVQMAYSASRTSNRLHRMVPCKSPNGRDVLFAFPPRTRSQVSWFPHAMSFDSMAGLPSST